MAILLFCLRAWAGRCEDLAKTKSSGVTIDQAQPVTSGTFVPAYGAPLKDLQPFCRVALTARPSKDSDIKIELWLPETNWNGRLQGTGNGGFAGRISYAPLAAGLKHGYAVVNTDMGMATPPGTDASLFADRPERWKDWGYRATHEMTVVAKQLVKAYYSQPLTHSYFFGCSTGGQQALMEAEKFPEDYDGIVGGAPAQNRTGVHMSILWNFVTLEKDPAAYIPAAKLPMLTRAVLKACGDSSGIIAEPMKCEFDPALIQCKGADDTTCLTAPQVNAVRKLYDGPRNPRTGQPIYPGLTKGSEFGWDRLGAPPATAPQPPYGPIFQWAFGPTWNWRSFDFDDSTKAFENKLAGTLNALNPSIDTFQKRGGKLLLYHGWADWLVAPGETIRYFETVHPKDSVRLYMLPGVAHCGGGPGADQFDPLTAVVHWVEEGTPPANLTAVKLVNGKVSLEQTLCPYPGIADGTRCLVPK